MRSPLSTLVYVLSWLYYFFIGATMLYWIYVLAFQSAEYQLPIIWLPAAAAAIPLYVFRNRHRAALIMVTGNWLFTLVLFYLYFIDGSSEPIEADGQSALGNIILMLIHWIAVFVLFVVALIAGLFKNNSHKLR